MKILRRKGKDIRPISGSTVGYPTRGGVSFYCRRPFSESRIKVEIIRTVRGIEEVILKGYGKVPLRVASLILTGADSLSRTGIFNKSVVVTFSYKDEGYGFTFNKIDWKEGDSYSIKSELKYRIRQVQDWVEKIDNYSEPQSDCDDDSNIYRDRWNLFQRAYYRDYEVSDKVSDDENIKK